MYLRIKRWAASAAVIAVAIGVNWNILRNGFVYDDGSQILANPYIRGPQYLAKIFGTNVWSFLGVEGISNYYRPMMHLVYMADYQLFGFDPAGYHATSVAFHVACSLLVLYLGWALSGAGILPPSKAASASDLLASASPEGRPHCGIFPAGSWYALIAALLFAAHPIHTEAVAWAAGITELSYAFFFLWSVYLYVRGHAGWSAVLSLPALLAKETAIMLVPTLMVYEHWYRKPGRGGGYFLHLVPLAVYLDLRYRALGGLVMVSNRHVLGWGPQLLTTVYLLGRYLGKLVRPAPFNLYYVFHPVTTLADLRFLGAAALLASTAAGARLLWRRGNGLWFAVAWIVLPLVPVLYISRVGDNVFTERYLYLPSVGFCWLLAALLGRTGPGLWGAAAFAGRSALALLLIANYGLLTYYRNQDWHDDIVLYTVTLQVSPESDVIRNNLGSSFLARGMPLRALPLFIQAANGQPDNAEMQNNLGSVYAQMGRHEPAREAFERTTRLRPQWPLAWYNLGRVSEDLRDRGAAESAYRKAVSLNPNYAEARVNLGILLLEEKRETEAEQQFRAAGAHTNLGKLYLRRGRDDLAETEFLRAVKSNPDDAEAWSLLAEVQRRSGKLEEAVRSFDEARRARAASGGPSPPAEPGGKAGYNKTRRGR